LNGCYGCCIIGKNHEETTMGYWNSRGLRGSSLELIINETNKIYLEDGLAVIQKLPTSIKPVRLDAEHGTITLAYFDEKSTVDYMGNVQGIPICFDAKETSLPSLPIANIHEHQIEFMEKFNQQKGISFILVHFSKKEKSFLIDFNTLKKYWDNAQKGGRKSIPFSAMQGEFEVFPHKHYMLHYLEALNNLIIHQDNKY